MRSKKYIESVDIIISCVLAAQLLPKIYIGNPIVYSKSNIDLNIGESKATKRLSGCSEQGKYLENMGGISVQQKHQLGQNNPYNIMVYMQYQTKDDNNNYLTRVTNLIPGKTQTTDKQRELKYTCFKHDIQWGRDIQVSKGFQSDTMQRQNQEKCYIRFATSSKTSAQVEFPDFPQHFKMIFPWLYGTFLKKNNLSRARKKLYLMSTSSNN